MVENWDNVSEILLDGRNWNDRFRLQWYKISRITKERVYFNTQVGERSAYLSSLNNDGNSYRVKYKNPLVSKLNSL